MRARRPRRRRAGLVLVFTAPAVADPEAGALARKFARLETKQPGAASFVEDLIDQLLAEVEPTPPERGA